MIDHTVSLSLSLCVSCISNLAAFNFHTSHALTLLIRSFILVIAFCWTNQKSWFFFICFHSPQSQLHPIWAIYVYFGSSKTHFWYTYYLMLCRNVDMVWITTSPVFPPENISVSVPDYIIYFAYQNIIHLFLPSFFIPTTL